MKNLLLATFLFIYLFTMYSCSSENEVEITTNKELQEIDQLRTMYTKLKNNDTNFLDDLIKKYEGMESSKRTKSSTSDENYEHLLEYIDKYISGTEEITEDAWKEVNYEEIELEYVGEVDYDEIINDRELTVEEKEILILTFSHLDIVIHN